jgi:hypothetical protein
MLRQRTMYNREDHPKAPLELIARAHLVQELFFRSALRILLRSNLPMYVSTATSSTMAAHHVKHRDASLLFWLRNSSCSALLVLSCMHSILHISEVCCVEQKRPSTLEDNLLGLALH